MQRQKGGNLVDGKFYSIRLPPNTLKISLEVYLPL
jgi:hypothetical protein